MPMPLLYLRLIGARIRSQMQYKVSFWLELLGFAVSFGLEFAAIALLLAKFPSAGGWHIAEIALLYGLSSISFGLAEIICRGFNSPFELMMQRGSFDGLLTRPLGTFFQVLASEFQLRRLGRALQGALVFLYACRHLTIHWTPAHLLLVPLTLLSGVAVYMGLIVIGATFCFWTIKTPEVINIFTFGGDTLVSFPLSIYNGLIRTIFLFVIPVGFVNYPAALLLLQRTDPHGLPASVAWAAPLIGGLFFAVALVAWRIGVSKYTSAGS